MLIRADARWLPLADSSVNCVVTSPPYWGLRDYGTPGQLGLEPTPDAYVANLVTVFREVCRVLSDDGTCWVNLGDAYVHGVPGGACVFANGRTDGRTSYLADQARGREKRSTLVSGLKTKDLVGIPWRVAFALQADGWYLRSDIIWSKPNPMPESVTDRPTRAHEYLFLLAKAEQYFYDAEAIAESSVSDHPSGNGYKRPARLSYQDDAGARGSDRPWQPTETRNRRSVWTINTEPYPDAHFATFPEKLVEPCILAGCPLGGLVLDPFIGSGTVGAVAERFGRRWIGTDLTYQHLAKARTAQRGLRFENESEVIRRPLNDGIAV